VAIVYEPEKILKQIAPGSKIEKMLTQKASLKKTALAFVKSFDFIDDEKIAEVAIKTIKDYKKRIANKETKETAKDIVKKPKLLIARVQNAVVFQVANEIEKKYRGAEYEWLPSNADEPDPLHQLKYGKVYTLGKGEKPGDRHGCQCGMRLLVKDEKLKLD